MDGFVHEVMPTQAFVISVYVVVVVVVAVDVAVIVVANIKIVQPATGNGTTMRQTI